MKRTLALILAVILITLALASCAEPTANGPASSQPASSSGSSSGTTQTSDNPYDKHLDISWIGLVVGAADENSDMKKLVEEKFNVTLTMPQVDIYNQEQFNLFWASGETADHITTVDWVPDVWRKLVDQGLTREIPYDTMTKLMPKWFETLDSLIDRDTTKNQITYNGKVWCIPYLGYTQVQGFVGAVRQDWLDAVGISKPPATLDEFYNVCKAFAEQDPDKNGKKDTFGFTPKQAQVYIAGAFGIQTDTFFLKDGVPTYANTTNEYKDYLKFLAKCYAEGIAEPEFVPDKRADVRNKWSQGKFGFIFDHPWWMDSNTPDNVPSLLTNKDPKAKITFFDPFTGPTDKKGLMLSQPKVTENVYLIGQDTSDEKMERIMRIKESFAADSAWNMKGQYGDEGDTYNMKDGLIVPTEKYSDAEYTRRLGLGVFSGAPMGMDMFKKSVDAANQSIYSIGMKKDNIMLKGQTIPVTKPNASLVTRQADITKVDIEFFANAVTGKVDIDKEWDNYLKNLDAAGLKDVMTEFNQIVVK